MAHRSNEVKGETIQGEGLRGKRQIEMPNEGSERVTILNLETVYPIRGARL
jgi:hypothetical protein